MITLISALFPALDQNINHEKWKDLLSLLIDTQIPLVLYIDPELMVSLEASFDLSRHVIRVMDNDKLTQGLWLFDKFYKLGKEKNLTDETLITLIIRIRSLGWLNDESILKIRRIKCVFLSIEGLGILFFPIQKKSCYTFIQICKYFCFSDCPISRGKEEVFSSDRTE